MPAYLIRVLESGGNYLTRGLTIICFGLEVTVNEAVAELASDASGALIGLVGCEEKESPVTVPIKSIPIATNVLSIFLNRLCDT